MGWIGVPNYFFQGPMSITTLGQHKTKVNWCHGTCEDIIHWWERDRENEREKLREWERDWARERRSRG